MAEHLGGRAIEPGARGRAPREGHQSQDSVRPPSPRPHHVTITTPCEAVRRRSSTRTVRRKAAPAPGSSGSTPSRSAVAAHVENAAWPPLVRRSPASAATPAPSRRRASPAHHHAGGATRGAVGPDLATSVDFRSGASSTCRKCDMFVRRGPARLSTSPTTPPGGTTPTRGPFKAGWAALCSEVPMTWAQVVETLRVNAGVLALGLLVAILVIVGLVGELALANRKLGRARGERDAGEPPPPPIAPPPTAPAPPPQPKGPPPSRYVHAPGPSRLRRSAPAPEVKVVAAPPARPAPPAAGQRRQWRPADDRQVAARAAALTELPLLSEPGEEDEPTSQFRPDRTLPGVGLS